MNEGELNEYELDVLCFNYTIGDESPKDVRVRLIWVEDLKSCPTMLPDIKITYENGAKVTTITERERNFENEKRWTRSSQILGTNGKWYEISNLEGLWEQTDAYDDEIKRLDEKSLSHKKITWEIY